MDMLAAMRRYGWMLGLLIMAVGQCEAVPTEADVVVKPMRENAGADGKDAQAPAQTQMASANTLSSKPVNTSKLKLGTWSYEVEQMARADGCQGSGAWLVKDAEGSQHYRMQCASGVTYAATCNTNGQCLED